MKNEEYIKLIGYGIKSSNGKHLEYRGRYGFSKPSGGTDGFLRFKTEEEAKRFLTDNYDEIKDLWDSGEKFDIYRDRPDTPKWVKLLNKKYGLYVVVPWYIFPRTLVPAYYEYGKLITKEINGNSISIDELRQIILQISSLEFTTRDRRNRYQSKIDNIFKQLNLPFNPMFSTLYPVNEENQKIKCDILSNDAVRVYCPYSYHTDFGEVCKFSKEIYTEIKRSGYLSNFDYDLAYEDGEKFFYPYIEGMLKNYFVFDINLKEVKNIVENSIDPELYTNYVRNLVIEKFYVAPSISPIYPETQKALKELKDTLEKRYDEVLQVQKELNQTDIFESCEHKKVNKLLYDLYDNYEDTEFIK